MPQPLLDKSQQDQALRDLMPVLHWITNADAAMADGAFDTARWSIAHAIHQLRKMEASSPAVKAYDRWLHENIDMVVPPEELENPQVDHLCNLLYNRDYTK